MGYGKEPRWGRGYHPSESQIAAMDPSLWWHPLAWAEERELLATEVAVRWLDPNGRHLPWLRERFMSSDVCIRRGPRPRWVRAITVNRRGRAIRTFTAMDDDLEAYSRLMEQGRGTCPWEAVDPLTIAPAQPAIAAHPGLLVQSDALGPGSGGI